MKFRSDAPLLTLLKALIAVVSIIFICVKVNSRTDFERLQESLVSGWSDRDKAWLLIAVSMLMLLNWFLESVKWKLLLESFSPVGWLRSFRSVLSGVTVSIFTPNRIGEFAGRVLHLDPGVRIRGAIASVIGSMNQLLITVVAGGISLLTALQNYVDDIFIYRTLYGLILVSVAAAVFIYFKIPGIYRLTSRIRSFQKMNLYTSFFEKYDMKTLLKLTALSTMRYSVFTIQFALVLEFFNISIPLFEAVRAVSLMYLFMAIVPSLALSELTTRGSVALFVFESLTDNNAGVLAASTLIWFINLVIPASFGALAAFYFRFNKPSA